MFGFPKHKDQDKLLSAGDLKKLARRKPARPTVISQTTAERLAFLERHGLCAPFRNLVVAASHFRDLTGKLQKMPKGLIHGGV